MKYALSASLVILTVCTALAANAAALTVVKHDEPVTGQIVIGPPKVELAMKPGESVTRDITVTNRTGSTVTIEISTEDFTGSSNPSEAFVFKGTEDGSRGARRWLQPEISSLVLQQGETVTFKTRVNVSKDADPGGYYAALFASSTFPTENEQGATVDTSSRVFSLFLIEVTGAIRKEGTMDPPEVPSLSGDGPIDIGLVFRNQGNVHLKPSGRVTITNMVGQTVAEIPVSEWVVLPDSARRNIIKWDTEFMFGRYTVTAEIGFTADGTPIVVSSTFWAFPWKIMLFVALLVILMLVLTTWFVRRRRGRQDQAKERPDKPAAPAGIDTKPKVETGPIAGTAAEKTAPQLVSLDELFPSMGDRSLINIEDPDTQKLVRDLIGQQLDLAKAYIGDGMIDDARRELNEARSAALRIGFLSEVGVIDHMLHEL